MSLMGFFSIFRRKKKEHARPMSSRSVSGDETGPKNGPLTLAVAAALIIMVALAVVNFRLIRDRSAAGKGLRSSVPIRLKADKPVTGTNVATKKESCYVPPQVTFYRQLTKVDEHPGDLSDSDAHPDEHEDSSGVAGAALTAKQKKEAHRTTRGSDQSASSKKLKLPRSQPGRKRYTVQVGAFTNPGIAKQWAHKWKARGYMVSLKPVARPRTGVIYRLYLGSFSSERRADELVKRLKSKEGISALRLVVRN